MKSVTVIDHPLVQHKLTLMRDRTTSTAGFRTLLREIAHLLCYEVTRDIELEPVRLRQPAHVEKGERLAARVVQPADEDRILRNHDTALAQRAADARAVQHLRDGPRIRPADSAAARAAVVR